MGSDGEMVQVDVPTWVWRAASIQKTGGNLGIAVFNSGPRLSPLSFPGETSCPT